MAKSNISNSISQVRRIMNKIKPHLHVQTSLPNTRADREKHFNRFPMWTHGYPALFEATLIKPPAQTLPQSNVQRFKRLFRGHLINTHVLLKAPINSTGRHDEPAMGVGLWHAASCSCTWVADCYLGDQCGGNDCCNGDCFGTNGEGNYRE